MKDLAVLEYEYKLIPYTLDKQNWYCNLLLTMIAKLGRHIWQELLVIKCKYKLNEPYHVSII